MDKLYTYTIITLWLIWAIVCFVFYHKIFSVYYFDLFRGLYKEIFWCFLISMFLAGITLKFSTPLAIGLIIVGWFFTRNIDTPALRNISFALIAILAVVIFFAGKWFQKNIDGETAASHSSSAVQYDESYNEPAAIPTIHMTEVIPETEPYITHETEPKNYVIEETYYPSASTSVNDTPVVTEPQAAYLIGYVIESSGGLKIRSGPGTSYLEVGRLAPNEQVIIYEQIYGESYMWGKIDRGWVCMDYIAIGTAPDYKDTYAVGYIVGSVDGVNVRSGPAVSYEQVGRVSLGQQVIVTKLHNNGVSEWGYIGNGWVCTDYIHFGDVPPDIDFYGDSDPADSSISEWDTGEPQFVGYDSYGRELRVGNYVCIGARQGSSEYAVGTIISLQDNGMPVVEFTEIYNNNYPEEIQYCMNDLADKINYFGFYCGEVEAQYLQLYFWG